MRRLTIICSLACLVTACGGSSTDATQAGKAVEQAVTDAAAGKPSTVKVVPHETLRSFLPELPGWTRGEIRGETDNAMGINVSRVRADYEKDESSLTFELMDTSLNANLLTAFQMASRAGVEERRADGYTKATTVAGYPAVEEWSTEAKNGSIGLLAGGRYLLTVTGSTVPDVGVIRKAVEAVDLKKLGELK